MRWLAGEMKVDRSRLQRKLSDAGVDTSEGATIAEAFDALTAKSEREADLARRQKAEADTAEMLSAEKRGKLMLTANFVQWCRAYGAQVRAKIMEANHISAESKKRLCGVMEEIGNSEHTRAGR